MFSDLYNSFTYSFFFLNINKPPKYIRRQITANKKLSIIQEN